MEAANHSLATSTWKQYMAVLEDHPGHWGGLLPPNVWTYGPDIYSLIFWQNTTGRYSKNVSVRGPRGPYNKFTGSPSPLGDGHIYCFKGQGKGKS